VARAANWFSSEFQSSVKKAVQEVELATAAELVVAVRPSSGHYRHTDLGVGLALALVGLLLFLYHPAPFDFTYLPLELGALFALGVVTSVGVPPARRLFTRRRLMDQSVATAARSMFVELGVHRTRQRGGVLVLISSFERRAEVVADLGVPRGEEWTAWCERVSEAARRRDAERLLEALRELGPLLAEKLPRTDNDENELADDVHEVVA
jgi:putative membrane protein